MSFFDDRGKVSHMTTPLDFGALQRAVELLTEPHPQVLACLHRGDQPYTALAGSDPVVVDAAVIRLMGLGMVHPKGCGDKASAACLALTPLGHKVARLVAEDMQRFPTEPPDPVFDREEVDGTSCSAA